jgi:hypothetical protein
MPGIRETRAGLEVQTRRYVSFFHSFSTKLMFIAVYSTTDQLRRRKGERGHGLETRMRLEPQVRFSFCSFFDYANPCLLMTTQTRYTHSQHLHTTPAPKTTHESQRLVGGLSFHRQHHQRVTMTRWWVSTPFCTRRRPQNHPRVTTTRGWAFIPSPTPPTSHYDSLVGFYYLLHPSCGPKNHPRVLTTRGWLFI